jgi:glycopeptide antibiotics resistance protein
MLDDGFVVLAMMVVLPLVWWQARRAGLSRRGIVIRLAFVAWVAALVAVALFPLPLPHDRPPEEVFGDYRGWPYPWLSPVPFETIRSSLEQGWSYPAGKYLIGNIGAFVPLGVLAPMLWPRWRSWPRALLLGLLASGLLELIQLVGSLAMGFPWRVADVDDLLLNTLGTLIGFGIWRVGSAAFAMRRSAAAVT